MNALTLYPAIDLKDGACVRLRRGEMDQATVYSDDPGAQARAWQEAGCTWLHVVDLDGAFAGRPANAAAVEAILAAVPGVTTVAVGRISGDGKQDSRVILEADKAEALGAPHVASPDGAVSISTRWLYENAAASPSPVSAMSTFVRLPIWDPRTSTWMTVASSG
mgnify:CR=1 FL=1